MPQPIRFKCNRGQSSNLFNNWPLGTWNRRYKSMMIDRNTGCRSSYGSFDSITESSRLSGTNGTKRSSKGSQQRSRGLKHIVGPSAVYWCQLYFCGERRDTPRIDFSSPQTGRNSQLFVVPKATLLVVLSIFSDNLRFNLPCLTPPPSLSFAGISPARLSSVF